jgi:hypothetical protein
MSARPSFPYFLVNPAHDAIVRGDISAVQVMRGKNRQLRNLMIAASVISVLIVALFFLLDRAQSLAARGITTRAQVTRHAIEDQSRRDDVAPLYYLEYAFTVDGISYEGQEIVDAGTYNRVRDGDRVVIAYLPDDPRINEIVTGTNSNVLSLACFTGIGIALAGMIVLYQAAQQRRYTRGGVIQGEIIRVEQKMDTQRKPYYQVHYVFLSPQGARMERMHVLNGEKWIAKTPPPVGTPVFIQYANEREFQLL